MPLASCVGPALGHAEAQHVLAGEVDVGVADRHPAAGDGADQQVVEAARADGRDAAGQHFQPVDAFAGRLQAHVAAVEKEAPRRRAVGVDDLCWLHLAHAGQLDGLADGQPGRAGGVVGYVKGDDVGRGRQPLGRAVEPDRPGAAILFKDVVLLVGSRAGHAAAAGRHVDGPRRGRGIGDAVVGRGRGHVVVAGGVLGHVGGHSGDHCAAAGHAADSHGVRRAAAGDGCRGRPSRAAQRHVARLEAANGFAEDDGEVDRAAAGRVGLAGGLVDGDRRCGGVDRPRPRGRGSVGVARRADSANVEGVAAVTQIGVAFRAGARRPRAAVETALEGGVRVGAAEFKRRVVVVGQGRWGGSEHVGAVGPGLVGRLAVVVEAPAVDRPGRRQGAGVVVAGADLAVRAGLVGRLAVVVVGPAVDRPGRRPGTGVEDAGADLAVGAGLVGRLAFVVKAPAVERAGRRQGAGVVAAGAELGVGAGLVGRLAEVVVAPAVDCPGRRQGAGVV